MKQKIKELRNCFNKLFVDDILNNTFIEILDNDEIVISANKEGLLCLIDQIIKLCETDLIGQHYHLDECSIADKSDKPVVFSLTT